MLFTLTGSTGNNGYVVLSVVLKKHKYMSENYNNKRVTFKHKAAEIQKYSSPSEIAARQTFVSTKALVCAILC